MAYKHGVYTSEVPTSIIPAVNTTAGLPVVFGTAPVHLATDRAQANRPVLCYSYAEAVAAMGYCKDWNNYTLCEAIYSQFALYNVAPVVLVNVLDPAVHKTAVSDSEVTFTNKVVSVSEPVLLETLKVKKPVQARRLQKALITKLPTTMTACLLLPRWMTGSWQKLRTPFWITINLIRLPWMRTTLLAAYPLVTAA